MYMRVTIEHFNRKTEKVKKMVFTLNWYLYKTQLNHPATKINFQDKNTKIHRINKVFNPKINNKAEFGDFEKNLMKAIDDGLSYLGEESKQGIYYYLEKNFNISREEIPFKIEKFTEAIEEIFGIGAKILEIQIMQHLYKNTNTKIKPWSKGKNLTFNQYIDTLKNSNYEKLTKNQQTMSIIL
jgi:hypothetical protein